MTDRVFKGRVFSVETGTTAVSRTGRNTRSRSCGTRASVVLIPIEDDGRVVIVQQYRAPLDREMWEFPAGRLDEGESAEDAARRECEEEIGLRPAAARAPARASIRRRASATRS